MSVREKETCLIVGIMNWKQQVLSVLAYHIDNFLQFSEETLLELNAVMLLRGWRECCMKSAYYSIRPVPCVRVNYLRRRRRLCFWFGLFVCLSVCPSDYSQICERIVTKFFGGVGHGSRTKWFNFGGDPDHASDPGVQSPKYGSSGSAEVCALWVLLVKYC